MNNTTLQLLLAEPHVTEHSRLRFVFIVTIYQQTLGLESLVKVPFAWQFEWTATGKWRMFTGLQNRTQIIITYICKNVYFIAMSFLLIIIKLSSEESIAHEQAIAYIPFNE